MDREYLPEYSEFVSEESDKYAMSQIRVKSEECQELLTILNGYLGRKNCLMEIDNKSKNRQIWLNQAKTP